MGNLSNFDENGGITVKKLVAIMMAVAMSFSCFALTVSAVDINENAGQDVSVSAVQPKQILTYTHTQYVYSGVNVAKITMKYTARDDEVNDSGYYITGILNASIKKVKGWTAVGSVSIKRASITYTRNHQIASVPISYEASSGQGYNTYTDTIRIELK